MKILRFTREIHEKVKTLHGEDIWYYPDNTVGRPNFGQTLGILSEYKGKVVYISNSEKLTKDGLKVKKLKQQPLF